MQLLDDEKITELEFYVLKHKNISIDEIINELGLRKETLSFDTEMIDAEDVINEVDLELTKKQLRSDIKEVMDLFGTEIFITFNEELLSFDFSSLNNKKIYLFCLFLAKNGARGVIKEEKYTSDKLGELFEHIVHIALEESRIDYTVRRLTNIHKELKEICEECGIQFHGLQRCNKDAEDGGVDLIAYRKTHDKSKRGHIILIQCAAGKNYKRKDKDCNLDHWQSYIGDLYTHTKMLAIPHIYLSRETHELGGQKLGDAGEIFDRICLWQFINDDKLKEKYPDSYKTITDNDWL